MENKKKLEKKCIFSHKGEDVDHPIGLGLLTEDEQYKPAQTFLRIWNKNILKSTC